MKEVFISNCSVTLSANSNASSSERKASTYTIILSLNKFGIAASGPEYSVPAIGWAATYLPRLGWSLIRFRIFDLVEPISMITWSVAISNNFGSKTMMASTGTVNTITLQDFKA